MNPPGVVLCVAPVFNREAPPLGLAYLKTALARKGIEAVCLDFSLSTPFAVKNVMGLSRMKKHFWRFSRLPGIWTREILKYRPRSVGFCIWESNRDATEILSRSLRKAAPDIIQIGGGPDCIGWSLERWGRLFDYVVEGEGEETLAELLLELKEKKGNIKTLGVHYRKSDQSGFSGPRPRIGDLDLVAFPDFSDFDLSAYRTNGYTEGLPLLFTRGCNNRCTFCPGKKYYSHQLHRSGKNLYEEVEQHVERYGVHQFLFNDDSLLNNRTIPEFEDFCDRIIRSKLDINWRIYGSPVHPAITRDFAMKMKKAGLTRITLGIESLSSKVRADMGKTGGRELVSRTVDHFLGSDVWTEAFFIYGYPNETMEDFRETYRWLQDYAPRLYHLCINCFVVNAEYLENRPGIVWFDGNRDWHPYKWRSDAVDLKARRERYRMLKTTLSRLGANFMIGDPYLKKYYREYHYDE